MSYHNMVYHLEKAGQEKRLQTESKPLLLYSVNDRALVLQEFKRCIIRINTSTLMTELIACCTVYVPMIDYSFRITVNGGK